MEMDEKRVRDYLEVGGNDLIKAAMRAGETMSTARKHARQKLTGHNVSTEAGAIGKTETKPPSPSVSSNSPVTPGKGCSIFDRSGVPESYPEKDVFSKAPVPKIRDLSNTIREEDENNRRERQDYIDKGNAQRLDISHEGLRKHLAESTKREEEIKQIESGQRVQSSSQGQQTLDQTYAPYYQSEQEVKKLCMRHFHDRAQDWRLRGPLGKAIQEALNLYREIKRLAA